MSQILEKVIKGNSNRWWNSSSELNCSDFISEYEAAEHGEIRTEIRQESEGSGEREQITEDEGYLLGLGLFFMLAKVACLEYKRFFLSLISDLNRENIRKATQKY